MINASMDLASGSTLTYDGATVTGRTGKWTITSDKYDDIAY